MANVDTCIISTIFWMNRDYFSEEQSQSFIGKLFLLLASNRRHRLLIAVNLNCIWSQSRKHTFALLSRMCDFAC